jgi:hypothetical protein
VNLIWDFTILGLFRHIYCSIKIDTTSHPIKIFSPHVAGLDLTLHIDNTQIYNAKKLMAASNILSVDQSTYGNSLPTEVIFYNSRGRSITTAIETTQSTFYKKHIFVTQLRFDKYFFTQVNRMFSVTALTASTTRSLSGQQCTIKYGFHKRMDLHGKMSQVYVTNHKGCNS